MASSTSNDPSATAERQHDGDDVDLDLDNEEGENDGATSPSRDAAGASSTTSSSSYARRYNKRARVHQHHGRKPFAPVFLLNWKEQSGAYATRAFRASTFDLASVLVRKMIADHYLCDMRIAMEDLFRDGRDGTLSGTPKLIYDACVYAECHCSLVRLNDAMSQAQSLSFGVLPAAVWTRRHGE